MNWEGLELSILGPACVAGLLVLSTHVPLGQQVLARGIIFIDLAIAQVAALGVILAQAIGVDEHGYDKTPLKPLHSMMRGWKAVRQDLHKVTCPLLVFRSAEDHVVDPSSARIILSQTSSTDARERVLDDSYHVATLDNDAETIFAESAEFIERVVATGHGAPVAEPVGEASE